MVPPYVYSKRDRTTMKWVVCLTHLAKLYKESRKKRCSSLLSGKYEKGGNYYRHAADTTEQPPFF